MYVIKGGIYLKKLLVYLKDYIKESILGPLFKLLEALFELFVPLVIAAIIDTGIENGDTGYIIKMCLVLVLLGFVGLAFSITAQYFAAKASVGFVSKIRHVLFGHIQSLSYSELDQIGTSTLITRMTSDMNQVQNGMNLALRLLLLCGFRRNDNGVHHRHSLRNDICLCHYCAAYRGIRHNARLHSPVQEGTAEA